jgi:membrane associated rhomboid family serine protease
METLSLFLIILIIIFLAYPFITDRRATLFLVSINFLIFSVMIFLYFQYKPLFYPVLKDLIFYPSDMEGARAYTMISSAFLHISPMHILMNMVFLFLLGFPLEIKAGSRKLIVVYVLSAIGGSFLYAILSNGDVPALGASGAISGIMGALLALYPRDEIPMFLGPIFLTRTPVYLAAAVFLLTEFAYAVTYSGDNIAHTAHIGGLIAGMVVGAFVSKIGVEKRPRRYENLGELASTPELRKLLKNIENEENEDVARAWLEEFVKEARCPRCGGELQLKGNEISCSCGYRLRI